MFYFTPPACFHLVSGHTVNKPLGIIHERDRKWKIYIYTWGSQPKKILVSTTPIWSVQKYCLGSVSQSPCTGHISLSCHSPPVLHVIWILPLSLTIGKFSGHSEQTRKKGRVPNNGTLKPHNYKKAKCCLYASLLQC